MFFLFVFALINQAYPDCPPINCQTDCGDRGEGCMIVQYDENGKICSVTYCVEKRGAIE